MTTSIVEYSPTDAALADLKSRLANVAYDVSTTKGMEIAKKDRAEVRGLRTALEAKRKEIKAPALERCRLIDAEASRITEELLALEKPIDEQIKAEEKRKEEEKAAKAEAERKRVAAIVERITAIKNIPAAAALMDSAAIAEELKSLEALEVDDSFKEFFGEAQEAKAGSIAALRDMIAARKRAEDEAARAKAEREAEEQRLAAERRANEEAAAKLKAEREEFERQQAEARRKADEERAEADRKAAAERAEADRQAREQREAEEKRLADERAELDRQRAEQEAREKAERERREAEEAEERRKAEALDADRQRRAKIAALVPPTAQEITQLVADHYALGDYATAEIWLACIEFPQTRVEVAA